MTKFQKRCETYDDDVKKQKTIIKFYKLITLMPAIFLFVLGIVLIALTSARHLVEKPWMFVILMLIGVVYLFVSFAVLKSSFKKRNFEIVRKFFAYYNPGQDMKNAKIVRDNKNIAALVNKYGQNSLFVFLTTDEMCFITSEMLKLHELNLLMLSCNTFQAILNKDFGKLIIPLNDIDNYRDNQMMVNFHDSVLKIDFADNGFMDYFISKKDFYFNVNKK